MNTIYINYCIHETKPQQCRELCFSTLLGGFTLGNIHRRCHQLYSEGKLAIRMFRELSLPSPPCISLCLILNLFLFPLWTESASVPAERKERRRERRGKSRVEEGRWMGGGGGGCTSCETSRSFGSGRWAQFINTHVHTHTAAKINCYQRATTTARCVGPRSLDVT